MKNVKVLSIVLLFSLVCSLIFCSCNSNQGTPAEFTVSVKSAGGAILEDVGIRIYDDEELESLVWAADLDENGETTFNGTNKKTYYAVLENVAEGYNVEESYVIDNTQTKISLESNLLSEDAILEKLFKAGSICCDFTVTDSKGITYTLSELLKTKKAVVLNFWFINCGPCKMEFPYLQEAYNAYSDNIEVLAINPVDGNDDSISAFAEENSLSFPMVSGDPVWENAFSLRAYPTTVVIDRFGTVAMVHKGYITETETFTTIFDFFSSDDYTQTVVNNIEDIKNQ